MADTYYCFYLTEMDCLRKSMDFAQYLAQHPWISLWLLDGQFRPFGLVFATNGTAQQQLDASEKQPSLRPLANVLY